MLLEDYFYNNLQVTSTMEDASDSASRAATDERLLENAFQLKLLCPSWEARDVLHAVGIELDRDDYDGLRKKIQDRVRAHIQQHGMPVLGSDDKSRVERAVAMLLLMTYNPEADGVKPIKLTDTMKIAGFSPNDCSTGTAPYMRCYRLLKKKGKTRERRPQPDAVAATTSVPARPPTEQTTTNTAARARPPAAETANTAARVRPPHVTVPSDEDSSAPILSPLTQDSSPNSSQDSSRSNNEGARSGGNDNDNQEDEEDVSTQPSSTNRRPAIIPDDFDENYYVWPIPYPDELTMETLHGNSVISLSARSKPKTIERLTTTKTSRNTTHAAQHERQLIAEGVSIRNSLYKAASILYASVVRQENTLTNFSTADKVATAFNIMSGAEFLSGNELQAAVKNGNVGKSPPRRGRVSLVPEDEFDAFCDAVFSFAALQQINSTIRTKKMELQTLVGEILNDKRKADGDEGMQTVLLL